MVKILCRETAYYRSAFPNVNSILIMIRFKTFCQHIPSLCQHFGSDQN